MGLAPLDPPLSHEGDLQAPAPQVHQHPAPLEREPVPDGEPYQARFLAARDGLDAQPRLPADPLHQLVEMSVGGCEVHIPLPSVLSRGVRCHTGRGEFGDRLIKIRYQEAQGARAFSHPPGGGDCEVTAVRQSEEVCFHAVDLDLRQPQYFANESRHGQTYFGGGPREADAQDAHGPTLRETPHGVA